MRSQPAPEQRTVLDPVSADAVPSRLQAEGLALSDELLAKLKGGTVTAEDIAAIRGLGSGVANAGVQNAISQQVADSYAQTSLIGKQIEAGGELIGEVSDVILGRTARLPIPLSMSAASLGSAPSRSWFPLTTSLWRKMPPANSSSITTGRARCWRRRRNSMPPMPASISRSGRAQ